MGLMNQPWPIVVGFETFVPFADPPFKACCKYTSFSDSDKVGRSCTDTLNCSKKFHQLRMLPLNTGTSNLGNLTPFVSVDADDEVVVDDMGEWDSSLIQREQVNISSSK